ncbi:protein toll-like [Centruroides sculpturatus]|uniref:protein toll-like n=1 Tax=Centruroides sculpturatus TaxID=218467 RepID=UPI000C6E3A6F|nr:protein toll-like [Centruroides sculpturatus]
MMKGLSNLRIFSINRNSGLSGIHTKLLTDLHNLTEFHAKNCSLSILKEDLFFDLINLILIDISYNQITYLPSNLLKNNKMLTKLFCSHNRISELPTGIFEGLSTLRELNLAGNQLKNLSKYDFQNLLSLKTLILSQNRLTRLPEDIFLTLSNLSYLDLSNNSLSRISGKHPFGSSKHLSHLRLMYANLAVFPMINWTEYNLTDVDFRGNRFGIVKLPIYTPNHMKMNLSNCKIETIYIDDWIYGFQMPTYDISSNEIICDYDLYQFVTVLKSNIKIALKMFPNIEKTTCYTEARNSWRNVRQIRLLDNTPFVAIGNYCPTNCKCLTEHYYVKLNCSRKGLSRIPEVLVHNARIVDLSNNYINEFSNVDTVTWKNVTHLYLSNNCLTNIPDYFLPSQMTFLSLDGNRLTELPPGLISFIDISNRFKIRLSGNDWNCDCDSRFTKDWLLRNMQKIADFSNVSCRTNSSLLSFTEIVYGDFCIETANNYVSVVEWLISVIVLSIVIVIGVIVFVYVFYCRKIRRKYRNRKGNIHEIQPFISMHIIRKLWNKNNY